MASLFHDLTASHPNWAVNGVGNAAGALTQVAQMFLIVKYGMASGKQAMDPLALMAGSLFVSGCARKLVFVGNDYLVRPIARRIGYQVSRDPA